MKKEYEEKLEKGKEFAKEHESQIKKALLYLGFMTAGAYLGIKFRSKIGDIQMAKQGDRIITDMCDAGANGLYDWMVEHTPDAIEIFEEYCDKHSGSCNLKDYYTKDPYIASLYAKYAIKRK